MKQWAEKFYASEAWKSTREAYLSSKDYLCERCTTKDNPIPAKVAHHKIYLTEKNIDNPSITLSWDKLEALCQTCHNKEHHGAASPERYFFDERGRVIPC